MVYGLFSVKLCVSVLLHRFKVYSVVGHVSGYVYIGLRFIQCEDISVYFYTGLRFIPC